MQDHQNFSESQIVFEDNHLIVINKKVGQLVQGDKTGDFSLLDLITVSYTHLDVYKRQLLL